jgi:hypothetical protein
VRPAAHLQLLVRRTAATTPDLSKSWKKKFSIIEKAGGTKLPKVRELTFGELFLINLNFWAYLFGPFYYLAKGMWKKAVLLFGLCVIGAAVLDAILESNGMASTITRFIAPAVFGVRANMDYYKKVMLGENRWW